MNEITRRTSVAAKAMTVAELRAALEQFPGDLPIEVFVPDPYDGAMSGFVLTHAHGYGQADRNDGRGMVTFTDHIELEAAGPVDCTAASETHGWPATPFVASTGPVEVDEE